MTALWGSLAKRLRRAVGANETSARIAGSWALGIAIGLSPLIGIHTLVALLTALLLRLNKVDVVLGTLVINPWTLPVYFPTAVLLGQRLTGVELVRVQVPALRDLLSTTVWQAQAEWMRPLLIAWGTGAVVLATLAGAGTFLAMRWLIDRRRQARGALPCSPPSRH